MGGGRKNHPNPVVAWERGALIRTHVSEEGACTVFGSRNTFSGHLDRLYVDRRVLFEKERKTRRRVDWEPPNTGDCGRGMSNRGNLRKGGTGEPSKKVSE